ncbi:hypothetical protein NW767_015121 [Fusarium falciforme]|nr:hypothetical protein NW767_015121 [Fusarium falciforme]
MLDIVAIVELFMVLSVFDASLLDHRSQTRPVQAITLATKVMSEGSYPVLFRDRPLVQSRPQPMAELLAFVSNMEDIAKKRKEKKPR